MIYCSIPQALRFISSLDDCYYGSNSYGGDTAEIYTYTLHEHEPVLHLDKSSNIYKSSEKGIFSRVAATVFDLCAQFSQIRECTIYINNREYGEWVLNEYTLFRHRFHITIKPE